MKLRPQVAVALLLIHGEVSAQTACPQGVATGSAQCGPSSMVDPAPMEAPATPVIRWADSWGAIASDGHGNFGIVTELPTRRMAKNAAIDECRNRGGGQCEVRRTFVNQCAAVIAGDGATAIANAPTAEEAAKIGTPICSNSGGKNCHVYYSGCSLAKRIQ